jgi:hypothetical protein
VAAPTITTGILTGGSNSHQTSSEEVNAVATDFVSEGIVGTFTNTSGVAPSTGAFAVNAQGSPDATIQISTGIAYVSATPTSQNSQSLRVKCSVSGSLTISANASGSTKYDWIYIAVSSTNAANPNSGADNVATIVASRSSSASSDDGTPPTYGYPIAVVTVANGFSTITNGNIRDVRTNCIVNLGSSSVSSGWTDLGYTPNTVTYNGNRSYNLVFNSTDLTSTLSNGMRFKTTRLVSAPTRCTDLESGSSQYFNKTSPAGTTFTDDFVAMGWVKLESYTSFQTIISRYNGTSGWQLSIESTGQVSLYGYNASSSNFSKITSPNSIPLGRWVHIAAQLDMSAFTSTATTSYIMIDGIDVTSGSTTNVSRGGTNPTALVQAGNLEVGASNGGSVPFDGKLAQVAYFSAKVTQSTVLGYISQGLAGSETNLVSAYSFNNSISDLSSNANNLTAQNSAVATNADSPFTLDDTGAPTGTTDCAIIVSKTFSTNTTVVVQLPEGCTIPTSGGVSAVAYSTQKSPYGFITDSSKWTIETPSLADCTKSSPVSGTWYGDTGLSSSGPNITVPVGSWRIYYETNLFIDANTAAAVNMNCTLSTASNSESDTSMTCIMRATGLTTPGRQQNTYHRERFLTLSSATAYYLNIKTTVSSMASIAMQGASTAPIIIRAICTYI